LPPTILSSALDIGVLATGRPVGRLGDAKDVAAVVVLEVGLQVESEVARRIRAAGYTRQGSVAARGAELLGHILADLPAGVAS